MGELARVLMIFFKLMLAFRPAQGGNVERHRRLAGAVPARIGQFPYLVALLHPEVRCTGSLISDQWTLSAAHCAVVDAQLVKANEILMVAGVVDFNEPDSPTRQMRRARAIYLHPNFEELRIAGSDIALMKADSPFQMTDTVSAIRLSGEPFFVNQDTDCVASGWGDTKESSSNSKLHTLKVVAVQSKSVCHGLNSKERRNMICLRNNGGAGLCDGDSGGPLICSGDLVGVAHQVYIEKVNYSSPKDMDCGSETLVHTYMFTCPYLNWIRSFVPDVPTKPPKCFKLGIRSKPTDDIYYDEEYDEDYEYR